MVHILGSIIRYYLNSVVIQIRYFLFAFVLLKKAITWVGFNYQDNGIKDVCIL